MERDGSDFRFLSGRKWVARLRFYTSFTPALSSDFCFRSRYFRFRPGGKPGAFRVNIRADSYLGPILPGLRAEGHARGFGLGDHFRSGYFRFRCVQEAAPGADTTIELLVGAIKSGFSMWKARILRKIHQITPRTEITPNLITDQSTIINGDFATKIRRLFDFPTRK